MTIHDELETIPPEQHRQARDLLVQRAAISSTSTDMDAAVRSHERTRRSAKYGAGLALGIGALAAIVGFLDPLQEPLFIVLLALFLVTVFVAAGYKELGTRKFKREQRDLFILKRYDRLLEELRAGNDLTDEELTHHNLEIAHLMRSSRMGLPIFVQIGIGVLLVILCGIVATSLLGR